MMPSWFWQMPEIQSLTAAERLLFAYLLTNSYAHFTGIYYLPLEAVPRETGLTTEEVQISFEKLAALGLVILSLDQCLVFVKPALAYQYKTRPLSQYKLKKISRHLDRIPEGALKDAFLKEYQHLGFVYPPEYISKPKADLEEKDKAPKEKPQADRQPRAAEREAHAKTNIARPPQTVNYRLEDFNTFWNAYPKKVDKKKSLEAWKKLAKANRLPAIGDLIRAIEQQRQTRQWLDGYIPNPTTYLNGERWQDEVKLDVGEKHFCINHPDIEAHWQIEQTHYCQECYRAALRPPTPEQAETAKKINDLIKETAAKMRA